MSQGVPDDPPERGGLLRAAWQPRRSMQQRYFGRSIL